MQSAQKSTLSALMSLEKVARHYIMGEITVEALKSTTMDIFIGEFMVILGPSGSGKSTLLNLLGGMDRPSHGKILYQNKDIAIFSEQELTLFRRHEIGFVFQFYNLIPDLTAVENIALAAEMVADPLPLDYVLNEVGLKERRDHFPAQLSGGEQQRIAIARAIIKKPRILMCDEPTGALDFETGKSILSLLKKINQEVGSTVLIVTHNTAIGEIADRVVRMRSGMVSDISNNVSPLSPERLEW